MKAFQQHTGIAAPLDRANVDTDAIIPKQFLRKIERTGFGKHLFHEWRYRDYLGTDENPDFILNREPYRSATVLLARANFGCGSSREHAPWALSDYGFRVIIASSFADIFYHNALKNGILLIRLTPKLMDGLFKQVTDSPGAKVTADLEKQVLTDPKGREHAFEISAFSRHCLLNGLDPISWTLQFEDKIKDFEERTGTEKSWLA